MVCYDDEERVIVPRLLTRCLKEVTESHVGVPNYLVHGVRTLGELPFVFLGNSEGMV